MKAIERLFVFFEEKGLKHTPLEKELGLTNGYLGKMRDRKGSIGSDILETIFSKFPELNPDWLITGRGLMLYNQSKTGCVKSDLEELKPVSHDAVTLRFMDKLDEKDSIIKEKENKIEQLQTDLHEKSEELGGLKERIRQLESQNKESSHHSKVDHAVEAFISESPGDYGEGSTPTKLQPGSKRSSVGKV